MKWVNFFVPSKLSKNTEGHLSADSLPTKIKKHRGGEAYYCVFDCAKDELQLEGDAPTFKGYRGPVRPALGLVQFDFDSSDHEEAFDDASSFIRDLGIDVYFIAFSGSKGYHVAVPFEYFGLPADAALPRTLRDLAHRLKEDYPTLDTAVYNANRKFRVLNSRHPKTGLYKTLLTHLECPTDLTRFKRRASTYYGKVPPNLKPLPAIVTRLTETSEVSAVTSTREEQTKFESYDGKVCIKRLLTRRCDEGARNDTALVLVNDYYKTGKHQEDCERAMRKWAALNGLPVDEALTIVSNIYSGRGYYNHGCKHYIKEGVCSGRCPVFKRLHPEKRPEVVDGPKNSLPTEFEVIETLMDLVFGCTYDPKDKEWRNDGRLLKQGRDLFFHQHTHWEHLDDAGIDKVKTRINLAYGNLADFSRVDKTFRTLLLNAPHEPMVDFFQPNPFVANFTNGSLHLMEDSAGKYALEFRDHRREDYLTNIIPLEYDADLKERNTEFEGMLGRIFKGDPDSEEKIRAIAQMYGACLLPAFPHLFFLYGVAMSGKSTICLILEHLLHKENICGVQPHEFNGFHMQGMAGKLVNLVTDINPNVVISDDVIKQIEDRKLLRIQRKNKTDIMAPLPAIHIFGANDLPKTFDGSNRTHDRRWTIIRFNNPVTGSYMRNYSHVTFRRSPQGVLNFAVRGLQDLVDNHGVFLNPVSGREALLKWQTENDIIQCFLDDIRDGEANAQYSEEHKIKRSELWEVFRDWLEVSRGRNIKFSKHVFYRVMDKKGYSGTHFKGIRAKIG